MHRNLLRALAFSVAPAVSSPGGRKQTWQVPAQKGDCWNGGGFSERLGKLSPSPCPGAAPLSPRSSLCCPWATLGAQLSPEPLPCLWVFQPGSSGVKWENEELDPGKSGVGGPGLAGGDGGKWGREEHLGNHELLVRQWPVRAWPGLSPAGLQSCFLGDGDIPKGGLVKPKWERTAPEERSPVMVDAWQCPGREGPRGDIPWGHLGRSWCQLPGPCSLLLPAWK